MKIEYTKKYFFQKYAYKLSLLVKGKTKNWYSKPRELRIIPTWIKNNLTDTDYKVRNRFQSFEDDLCVYHQLIYCKDAATKDRLLATFGKQVVEICQPLDDNHKDNLEVKNIIEVRKTLIYKKYRYAVYFKYDRSHTIYPWLQQYFDSQKDTALVAGCNWWPKVYLTEDHEIMSIRLTWQDQIDYIKTVRLLEPVTP